MIFGTLEYVSSSRGTISVVERSDEDTPEIRVRLRRPLLSLACAILAGLIWSSGLVFLVFLAMALGWLIATHGGAR